MQKLKRLDQNKKIEVCIYGIFLVLFAVVTYFFPYSGDDLAWGSQLGLDRLANGFDNYNGRYLGNLLIIIQSRSIILNVIIKTLCAYLCVFLTNKYCKSKSIQTIMLTMMFLVIMPKRIFVQSIVWTSGFTNYVPSILLFIGYLVIIRNIFKDEMPTYNKFTPIAVFAMGVCGALFMENVTLHNIAMGILVIIYVGIKHKKVILTHVTFVLGAIVGAVIMFTNSVYLNIASGTDDYRTVSDSLGGIVKIIAQNIVKINNYVFVDLFVINIIISVMLVVLFTKRKDLKKSSKIISTILILLNYIGSASSLLFKYTSLSTKVLTFGKFKGQIIILAFALMFYASALIVTLILVKDKSLKVKSIVPLVSIAVLTAPLFVVDPIGPRCFFATYLMLIVYTINLYSIIEEYKDNSNIDLIINSISGINILCLLIAGIVMYSSMSAANANRIDFVKEQINDNNKTVTICRLPNDDYLWRGTYFKYKSDIDRFNGFYKLDKNTKYKVIPYKDFDKYVAQYEAAKE